MSRPVRDSGRRPNSRSRLWIWPAAVALVAAVLGPGAQAGADSDRTGLPEAIDTILGDPRMEGGVAGVVVADADSGELLYQHLPSTRLMPASNTKLTTSAAAMEILGPDHRFGTDVLATGRQSGSRLKGDLYLRGTGDPTLLAGDYDALAQRIAAAGITRVDGRLVADDTRFDDHRLGRSWAADDESSYYSAQISALSVAPDTDYDTGTVIVTVRPGASAGDAPVVTVTPDTDYVDIEVDATTVAAGGANDLTVEREHGTNTVVVSGTTPVGGTGATEWVTVWDPTGYAAAVFRDALAEHGVKVAGPTRTGLRTPAAARRLASHDSMPLKDLLIPFMKLSNNMHAEILTKAMGVKISGRGAGRPDSRRSAATSRASASTPASCGRSTAPGSRGWTTSRPDSSSSSFSPCARSPGTPTGTAPCPSPAPRTGSSGARCARGCAVRPPRSTPVRRRGR